jgi:hypothetical protein
MSYIIINYDADYMDAFASMISDYINNGYIPIGGPFIKNDKIYQALYKKDKEKDEKDDEKED